MTVLFTILSTFALLFLFITASHSLDYSNLNPRCKEYIPMLLQEQEQWWPTMENPSVFAAQIDQETCAGQKSAKCWHTEARLKTSREEGYGLGQITRTWQANGAIRFDALAELRAHHMDALKDWSWKNVATALFQIRGLVLMNYDNYKSVPSGATALDRYAFMDAAYNGGLGGLLSEVALCKKTEGCDSSRWFGNVENTSKKARTAVNGYGQGFFQINRGHVRNVIYDRRQRYIKAGMN
jgi:hypothetical protein